MVEGIRFLDINMERFVTDMHNKWKAKRGFKVSMLGVMFLPNKQFAKRECRLLLVLVYYEPSDGASAQLNSGYSGSGAHNPIS